MQYVDEHVIEPLGLERTTWQSVAPRAQGYLVDDYARTVWAEPELDLGGVAAMGQLWSTVEDLARWATFLARGEDGVLDPKTVEEMWFPQVMYYPDDWVLGWGARADALQPGRNDLRRARRRDAGPPRRRLRQPQDADRRRRADELRLARRHGRVRDPARAEGDGALAGADRAVAARGGAAGGRPRAPRRLVVGGHAVRVHVGEGVAAREGHRLAPGRGETTFERDGDGWIASAGRERGERLRVEGEQLVWAGYPFTRAQQPFAAG